MTDMELAAEALAGENITFAAAKDGEVITSEERGIKPLLDLYDSGKDMTGWTFADKVVGRAPAFMYTLLSAGRVYAPVMTEAAKGILSGAGIDCTYDTLIDVVMRRDGKDLCPMEKAVKGIDDPEEALEAVRKTAAGLFGK